MAYTDFAFYQGDFFGTVITDGIVFRRMAERASEYLDMATFDRLTEEIPEKYAVKVKKCCCALAEAVYQYQYGGADGESGAVRPKTQESIGSYSVSYGSVSNTLSALLDGDSAGLEDYLHSVCMKYLGTSGLLFRGDD